MAQHYDNAAKYIMLEYSQEFAEFMVGHSDITVLEMQAPGLLPFTPLMKSPEGIDPSYWLEKCVDVTASARTDQHTRDTLLAALGVFSGLVYEPQLIKQLLPEGIMQESPFFQHYIQEATEVAKQEGLKEGIEQGEKKGTIENIIALLGMQFETDAVQALKPALESIDDLQNLKQLLLAVPQSDSLEAFMQSLSNRNGN